jgi:ankyrin repeat protein
MKRINLLLCILMSAQYIKPGTVNYRDTIQKFVAEERHRLQDLFGYSREVLVKELERDDNRLTYQQEKELNRLFAERNPLLVQATDTLLHKGMLRLLEQKNTDAFSSTLTLKAALKELNDADTTYQKFRDEELHKIKNRVVVVDKQIEQIIGQKGFLSLEKVLGVTAVGLGVALPIAYLLRDKYKAVDPQGSIDPIPSSLGAPSSPGAGSSASEAGAGPSSRKKSFLSGMELGITDKLGTLFRPEPFKLADTVKSIRNRFTGQAQPTLLIEQEQQALNLTLFEYINSGLMPGKLKSLIHKGANVNAVNSNGDRPLHSAILNFETGRGSSIEIVRLLLDLGADVNAADYFGETPLHRAVSRGNVDIVVLLLERGAYVNTKNNDGKTPLSEGISRKSITPEIVSLLLESGAKPDVSDNQDMTSLHWAVDMDSSEVIEETEIEIIRLLLEKGANPNAPDNEGQTPLHLAISKKNSIEVIRLLLEKGANPNARGGDGVTPLHLATFNKSPIEVVRLLLKKGANPDALDNDGRRPFDLAMRNNKSSMEVVNLLSEFTPPHGLQGRVRG